MGPRESPAKRLSRGEEAQRNDCALPRRGGAKDVQLVPTKGRPSRSAVQQALITQFIACKKSHPAGWLFFFAVFYFSFFLKMKNLLRM